MAYNILIVDDSATVRAVLSRIVRLCGLDLGVLHEAANGKEALEVLEEHWVDLVLADINMPVMNGLELVERMQADGLLETIPVVIVSTEGSQTRVKDLRARGVRGYVRKPFTPEHLRLVVERILREVRDGFP
jgi:two-component system chemotaxis response regulator CheY